MPNSWPPSLLLAEDDPRSTEELEKLAIENLQLIIYQANEDLVKRWLPIISSALKAGRMGEALIMGYCQYACGENDELRATLRLLEAEAPSERYQQVIKLESMLLQMRNEFNFGNFDAVKEIYLKLPNIDNFPITRNNDQHYSKHRSNLVSAFYLQDRKEFSKHYSKIEEYLTTSFGTLAHIAASSYKAMNAFLHGRYLEANDYALGACKLADDLKVTGAYTPFEAAYILADTYLEFGEDKKSLDISERYLEVAIKYNQYPWITAFYAKAALIKLQEGNISGALSLIRKGREKVDGPLFGPILSFHLDYHELLIRLPLGDMERIGEIIYRLPEIEMVKDFKMMLELYRNPAAAAMAVNSMPKDTDQDKFRVESLMALLTSQNKPQAKVHLQNAIDLAIPNGYFRAFLNLPPEVKTLILDLATEKPTIYMEKLASAITAQISASQTGANENHEPLTKRELEVLRRLGTSEPITKIAAALHISNNTIKTHLKKVYRKLNVESREQAVARGKELSLL